MDILYVTNTYKFFSKSLYYLYLALHWLPKRVACFKVKKKLCRKDGLFITLFICLHLEV